MTDNRPDPTELSYRFSVKNVVIFSLIWLGAAFLILMFVKWVIHGSAALYLFMVPWTIFGLVMVVRPNWIMRMARAWERNLERGLEQLDKRLPPGFP